jgi:hypothetical protein
MTQKLPAYFEKYFEQKFSEVNDRLDDMTTSLNKFDTRVSCVETWKSELVGKLTIISVVVVLILNLTVDWFKKKLSI